MDFEYPGTYSFPIWPPLCIILSDWWRYALTRHIGTQLSTTCVCLSNQYFDYSCIYGYLSAKDAVFVLTVLCQRMSVERIFEVFFKFFEYALKIIWQQVRHFEQHEYGSNAPPPPPTCAHDDIFC